MKKIMLMVAFLAAFCLSQQAEATILDLTSASADGFINTAYFIQIDPNATGTGNIKTFVQLGDATPNGDVIEGYNTTVNNVFDNGSSDVFNHELLLADVPLVMVNDILYREFLLDVNENLGASAANLGYISLDEIQILLSNTPNQGVETFSGSIINLSDSELIYRMDSAAADNYIILDAGLNSGSGSGDMLAYIPESLFSGKTQTYVYLYSRFGENYTNSSGFEEWAVRKGADDENDEPVIPEPATLFLLFPGLLAAGFFRKK